MVHAIINHSFLRGAVNRKAPITNYKQPVADAETAGKSSLSVTPKVKQNRNYKTPYSTN